MQPYEYKQVLQRDSFPMQDARLAELGEEGWELVGIVETRSGQNYIFKRAKKEPSAYARYLEEGRR